MVIIAIRVRGAGAKLAQASRRFQIKCIVKQCRPDGLVHPLIDRQIRPSHRDGLKVTAKPCTVRHTLTSS